MTPASGYSHHPRGAKLHHLSNNVTKMHFWEYKYFLQPQLHTSYTKCCTLHYDVGISFASHHHTTDTLVHISPLHLQSLLFAPTSVISLVQCTPQVLFSGYLQSVCLGCFSLIDTFRRNWFEHYRVIMLFFLNHFFIFPSFSLALCSFKKSLALKCPSWIFGCIQNWAVFACNHSLYHQ